MKKYFDVSKKMMGLNQLLSSTHEKYGQNATGKVFFAYSNEKNMETTITELSNYDWGPPEEKTVRFAFLIGESAYLSLADIFKTAHIDAVFQVDINVNIFLHLGFMLDLLIENDSPAKFQQSYLKDHPLIKNGYKFYATYQDNNGNLETKDTKLTSEMLEIDLNMSKKLLKEKHFLEEKNYLRYQEIIKTLPFCRFYMDITSTEQIKKFLSQVYTIFQGYKVEFVLGNVSNVIDYDSKHLSVSSAITQQKTFIPTGNLVRNCNFLFKTCKNPVILYSTRSLKTNLLSSTYCIGVDQFAFNMKKYIEEINQTISSSSKVEEKVSKKIFLNDNDIGLKLRKMSADQKCFDKDNYVKILKQAKAAGVINHQSSNGNTALHWAAVKGNTEQYSLLIEYGADDNLKNKQGESAQILSQKFLKQAPSKNINNPIKTFVI